MGSPLSLIMVVLRASWADRIVDHSEGLGCAPARPTGLAQPMEEEEEEERGRAIHTHTHRCTYLLGGPIIRTIVFGVHMDLCRGTTI